MKSIKEFIEENKAVLPVYFLYTTHKKNQFLTKEKNVNARFYNTAHYQPQKFYKKISQILKEEEF